MNPKRQRAFTLIEMMAVVIIIGILAAVIATNIVQPVDKAKREAALSSLKQIESAITMYRLDTSRYPQSLRDLVKQPEGLNNWNGPYLKESIEPRDPWGNKFEFKVPGENDHPYQLSSLGADGQEGGEKDKADILLFKDED